VTLEEWDQHNSDLLSLYSDDKWKTIRHFTSPSGGGAKPGYDAHLLGDNFPPRNDPLGSFSGRGMKIDWILAVVTFPACGPDMM
jgi:hypothetical protein